VSLLITMNVLADVLVDDKGLKQQLMKEAGEAAAGAFPAAATIAQQQQCASSAWVCDVLLDLERCCFALAVAACIFLCCQRPASALAPCDTTACCCCCCGCVLPCMRRQQLGRRCCC
jgi:hypothetical protein